MLSASALRAAAFPDWPEDAQPTLTWSDEDGSIEWQCRFGPCVRTGDSVEAPLHHGGVFAGEWTSQTVALEPVALAFGARWFFRCLETDHDDRRSRRVTRLYLPPASLRWACRHCHRLTYASRRHHDARLDAYRRDPALALQELEAPGLTARRLFLILRAFGVVTA